MTPDRLAVIDKQDRSLRICTAGECLPAALLPKGAYGFYGVRFEPQIELWLGPAFGRVALDGKPITLFVYKLEKNKFCPFCRKHTSHKEKKL